MKMFSMALACAGLLLGSAGWAGAGDVQVAGLQSVKVDGEVMPILRVAQPEQGQPPQAPPATAAPPSPQGPQYGPPPEAGPHPQGPQGGPPPESVRLFPHVKYKDFDEMHPCAVPMVVCVPHPCDVDHECSCCPQRFVHVKICVPPHCCPPEIDIDRGGREYEYKFDDYEVDVRLKDEGYVEVDYQD